MSGRNVIDSDIATFDLDANAFKACLEEGWSIEQVDKQVWLYRVFLHMIRHYPHLHIIPTRGVDVIWHHHILDTEKYFSDCQQLFGRYIHHYPYSGVLGEDDSKEQRERFQKTQQIMQAILSA